MTPQEMPPGIRLRGRIYYYRFVDENGKRIERRGVSNLNETQRLRAAAMVRSARITSGLATPEEIRRAENAQYPIADLLTRWQKNLKDRGNESHHFELVHIRATKLLAAAKVHTLAQLPDGQFQAALGELIASGTSERTANHYRAALRNFVNWLIAERLLSADQNPLGRVAAYSVPGLVHPRRALTEDEARRLVEAAERGPQRNRLAGPDRAWCYRVALVTGLRRDELRSLTRDSFRLDSEGGYPPSVIIPGAETKNDEDAWLPIPTGMVPDLKCWLSRFGPEDRVFPMGPRSAEAMGLDLEDAGIRYKNRDGYADFHAIRATFATNLIRSGVDVKTAQTLLRHSDIRLTVEVYAKVDKSAVCRAVELLAAPLPSKPPVVPDRGGSAPTFEPPRGVNKTAVGTANVSPQFTFGKRGVKILGDSGGVQGLAEMAALWARLPGDARASLLELAREEVGRPDRRRAAR